MFIYTRDLVNLYEFLVPLNFLKRLRYGVKFYILSCCCIGFCCNLLVTFDRGAALLNFRRNRSTCGSKNKFPVECHYCQGLKIKFLTWHVNFSLGKSTCNKDKFFISLESNFVSEIPPNKIIDGLFYYW